MRRFGSLLLALCLVFALAGCGGGERKETDVRALAAELAEQVAFDAPLKELTAEQLGNYLTLPEGAEAAAYMSGGTTAEEIIAVRCGSDGEAKALKEALQSFLADQRTEMERYQPEEVARMEKAILAQRGSCVVLCVCGDTDTAEQIIKEHLG